MTGLEKIIREIRDEAEGEAAAVTKAALGEAEAVLAAAAAEGEATAARIMAAAAAEIRGVEQGRESAAALQRRQRILAEKQRLIAGAIDEAQRRLHALPDDEYFGLLVKLAAGAAQAGDGVLLLNGRDLARAPSDFAARLSAALPRGARLALSADTRPIDGGFVLAYGNVEENCSFGAIFSARADEFSDIARDALFA